jgi:predicted O-methyltransferase YrrM
MLKKKIKNLVDSIPYVKRMIAELDKYKKDYEPGHYHSPIVSVAEVSARTSVIFDKSKKGIAGVELREVEQIELLHELSRMYDSIPFKDVKQPAFRYYFDNGFYCQSDGIFLHLVMRHFKPKRIIEIGSGFSSALMLDTNELFFGSTIDLTFIEPYPNRLFSLVKSDEKTKYKILETNLQDVPLERFDELGENDILFVDSTHVSKTGSDVNRVIFDILPRLKKGVLIHFHDIFYPFEYPKEWVLGWNGFGWNEDYILRAFLMHNPHYEIVLFNTFLENFHREWFERNMPNCLKDEGGSLWLRKN